MPDAPAFSPPSVLPTNALNIPTAGNNVNFTKQLNKPFAGLGDSKLLSIGDSIFVGTLTSVVGRGATAFLTTLLAGYGYPVAEGLSAVQLFNTSPFNDPRWTLGSGWTLPASPPAPPGAAGAHNSWAGTGPGYSGANGALGTLTFQPASTVTYDNYDVYYVVAGPQGFSVNFNGGANTVVSSSTPGIFKVTVTGTATSRPTCNMSAPTGFGCVIIGVEGWLSTTPKLRIGNAAVVGSTAGNWIDNTNPATGPFACLTAYSPNIVVISLGINDMDNNVTLPNFISQLNTLIQFILAPPIGAAVVLITEVPCSPTITGGTNLASQWWPAMIQYANQNNIPIFDVYDAWGTNSNFQALNAAGYYSDSVVHPSTFGDSELGRIIASGLLQL